MDFGSKLKRYVELRRTYRVNNSFHGNENLSNEYNELNTFFFNTYMQIRLRTGIDAGSGFNFEKWVDSEYQQIIDIENLLHDEDVIFSKESVSLELDRHMAIFDDLGFKNSNVSNWHRTILVALKDANYVMSDFYLTDLNKDNKKLFQHIALKVDTYNFLNSKGILNTGYCPITGEKIDNTLNYNIFNRVIYLSSKGLDACKNIDKQTWGNKKLDYDSFQNLKKQTAQKSRNYAQLVILILVVISIIISWNIVSPSGFFSFIGFLILPIVFFYILSWLFNLIFDFSTTRK